MKGYDIIDEELKVWPGDVMAMVLGGHGDSMVPMARYPRENGIPVDQLLDQSALGVKRALTP